MNELTAKQEDNLLEQSREDYYNLKCLGQDICDNCPRYLDDCDGKEEEDDQQEIQM